MDKGRCNLLGVMVNREGEEYAALADLMNTFFGHGDIPIGLERNGVELVRQKVKCLYIMGERLRAFY